MVNVSKNDVIDRILSNNHRTISKVITQIESENENNHSLHSKLYPYTKDSLRIGITGPPGAGKGTQAKILAKKFNLVHLSTGDILRKEIDKSSEVGLKAQTYMNAGNLVPDEVLLEMMQSTLTELKNSGVILDGFPRTIPQAIGLSKFFNL